MGTRVDLWDLTKEEWRDIFYTRGLWAFCKESGDHASYYTPESIDRSRELLMEIPFDWSPKRL